MDWTVGEITEGQNIGPWRVELVLQYANGFLVEYHGSSEVSAGPGWKGSYVFNSVFIPEATHMAFLCAVSDVEAKRAGSKP